MLNTALSAKKERVASVERVARCVTFKDTGHRELFLAYLPECRRVDVYHAALVYCLGISEDTRRNIKAIYDFKTGYVKTECLESSWITSGSARVIRLAFNLYSNAMPSVNDCKDVEEQLRESKRYTVEDLFCCEYAKYFWQAIRLRYPEHC